MSPETRLPRQVMKFLVSGGCGGAADVGLYAVLTAALGVAPLLANMASRPLGGVVGFVLNRYWTFPNPNGASGHIQFLRFCAVWCAAFALSELVIWLLNSVMAVGPVPSKLAAEALGGLLTFLAHKFWTYR